MRNWTADTHPDIIYNKPACKTTAVLRRKSSACLADTIVRLDISYHVWNGRRNIG